MNSPNSPASKLEQPGLSGEPSASKKGLPAEKILTANFLFVWLANFTSFGSFHLLWAVLPLYVLDIGGTATEIGLVVGAFAAASLITRPLVGRASDVRGKKVFMLAAAIVILLATLLYNFAHGVPSLLAVRVLHGLGWGTFSTIATALAADTLPERRRGEAMGYFGIAPLLSIAAWPAVGVFLQKSYGFTFLFYSTSAVALICLVTTLPVPEPVAKRKSAPATRRNGLSHILERSALPIAGVAGLLFLTHASIVSFLPVVARERGMENPGLFFTVLAITGVLGRALTGRLSDRYGRGVMSVPGMAAAAVSLVLLAYAQSLSVFIAAAVLFGLAMGTVQPDMLALTIDRVPPESRGLAMSTYTTAIDLGVWVGAFLWGVVAQFFGFTAMYLLAAVVALAGGVIVGLRLRGRGKPLPGSN